MSGTNAAVEHFAKFGLGVCLVVSVLTGRTAWAWPPTYGAEFEIASPKLARTRPFDQVNRPSNSAEKKEQMAYVARLRERCVTLGCQIEELRGKWDIDFKVVFSDGWFFTVSYDPGCVEITFTPSNLVLLNSKKDLIDDAIFKTGKELGMRTPPEKMNHFNIGIRSAFDDSGKEFLKFFVDYANHPDLALGGLGNDIYNSPPLSVLGEEQRQALQEVIKDFDQGKLSSISEVAAAIQNRVYTKSYYAPWGGANHYQAVGLKYVNRTDLAVKDAPLELRSMWGQPNAETFNKIAQLMEGRIQYLKNSTQSIIYTASVAKNFDPTQLKTRFYIYVEETGLKYSDFEGLLRANVRRTKIAAFLDRNEPIEKRLLSANDYWDLIAVSPLVRQNLVLLLSHPDARNSKKGRELLEKIQSAASAVEMTPIDVLQNQIDVPGKPTSIWSRFFRSGNSEVKKPIQVFVESKKQKDLNDFDRMLNAIHKAYAEQDSSFGIAGKCSKVFEI